MHSQWEDYDADTARTILQTAETKRPRTPSTIQMYKRDMLRGKWRRTHQGIAFKDAPDGGDILIDGGHRMEAIILADKEKPGIVIPIWTTYGFNADEDFDGVDIGRSRTAGNLVQAWYPDSTAPKEMAGIARRGIGYLSGHPWTRVQASKDELHQFLIDHPSVEHAAVYAHRWKMPRATLAGTAAGFVYWVLTRIDPGEGYEFMEQVRTGIGLEEKNPTLVLRNRLMGTDRTPYQGYGLAYATAIRGREPEIAIALTIMAWNKWREHVPIAKLQLPRAMGDDTFPAPREMLNWNDPRGLLAQ